MKNNMKAIATFGAGCFWCIEAMFSTLKGVLEVEPGYTGGDVPNPSYEQVCAGTTGHAEVIKVEYDESLISYSDLVIVFFESHDPTTLNRQGADKGTQYRSSIFYHNEYQKVIAEKAKEAANNSQNWNDPIVTEISAMDIFYPADNYHQDYYKNNPDASYCSYVIKPKLDDFKKKFNNLIK